MKYLDTIAFILVNVGALNWGLVAFDINLVTMLFGFMPMLVTVTYLLVGASAVYMLAKKFGK